MSSFQNNHERISHLLSQLQSSDVSAGPFLDELEKVPHTKVVDNEFILYIKEMLGLPSVKKEKKDDL